MMNLLMNLCRQFIKGVVVFVILCLSVELNPLQPWLEVAVEANYCITNNNNSCNIDPIMNQRWVLVFKDCVWFSPMVSGWVGCHELGRKNLLQAVYQKP